MSHCVISRHEARPRVLTVILGALCAIALLCASASVHAQTEDEVRGGLRVLTESGEVVDMPLTAISVRANVTGAIASVEVEQTFENPFDDRVEAVYIFPLPEDSAVTEMVMVVGDRRIRGELQEREEARRTYEAARDRGQTASLLEQERPNVFTQSVANIEPGHPISVLITYVEQLPYSDAHYHFAFPLVVGPRYIPGTPIAHSGVGVLHDTDEVPDASRITPPILPEDVSAPYSFDFELNLLTGMPIRELVSPSHEINADWLDEHQVTVTLPAHEREPNRDIVIDYALAGEDHALGVLTHYDDRGGFFSLMVEPPAFFDDGDVRPKELVFVIDMSGSMNGNPLNACKAAMRFALSNLNADDTFQIIRFSDTASEFAAAPVENTPSNVARGIAFVDALEGMGGTNMRTGIENSLSPPADPERMRIVLFMTDGFIGQEPAVLGLVGTLLGETRLFSLGVGSSVNRYLLDTLAEVGRGDVFYIDYDEDPSQAVQNFYERFRNPILTDIEVDWGGLAVHSVLPEQPRDVFANTPLMLSGRYDTPGSGTVTVRGLAGTEPVELLIDVDLSETNGTGDAIPFIWARRKVHSLELERLYLEDNRWNWEPGTEERIALDGARANILEVALEFGIMSEFTSFVAVEERIAVDASDPLHTVAQVVPLPAGVNDEHIGVQVSPDYVQPGDPVLAVSAPADTVAVTAYFHFGLVQTLDFNRDRAEWTSRFLVPRDVADGQYAIIVAIESETGTVIYEEVPLWVDATAPVITAGLSPDPVLHVDDVVTFEVDVLALPQPGCESEAFCAEILPERMKFMRLYLPDGRAVRMGHGDDDRTHWTFDFRIRERLGTGEFQVLVEAVDVAGNTTFELISFTVLPKLDVASAEAQPTSVSNEAL